MDRVSAISQARDLTMPKWSLLVMGAMAAVPAPGMGLSAQNYPGSVYAYSDGAGPGLNRPDAYGYSSRPNQQIAVNQCAEAAQGRLGSYAGGRVLGIVDAHAISGGGTIVRGVATSGRYAYAYAYGYGVPTPVDLNWRCRTDYRGYIQDVTIEAAGYGSPFSEGLFGNDYSQFGYRRY